MDICPAPGSQAALAQGASAQASRVCLPSPVTSFRKAKSVLSISNGAWVCPGLVSTECWHWAGPGEVARSVSVSWVVLAPHPPAWYSSLFGAALDYPWGAWIRPLSYPPYLGILPPGPSCPVQPALPQQCRLPSPTVQLFPSTGSLHQWSHTQFRLSPTMSSPSAGCPLTCTCLASSPQGTPKSWDFMKTHDR